MTTALSKSELERILIAAQARDCDNVAKVDNAGEITFRNGVPFQVMHNGLLVAADGYYGPFVTELVRRLKGHHEPQEELVFKQVLETLGTAPVMLEAGSYWAYYTMWFLKERPMGQAICAEPIAHRRAVGARNLAANSLIADQVAAAIAAADSGVVRFETGAEVEQVAVRSIDSLLTERNLDHLDILHIDIQGFERQALLGAHDALSKQRIDWIFVSTHRHLEEGRTMDLHAACIDLLIAHGYAIAAAHTPEESFSVDGLVVAKRPGAPGPSRIELSHLSPTQRAAAQAEAARLSAL